EKQRVLLAEIDSSVVANPGTHTVEARNVDGGTSATLTLTVVAQDTGTIIHLGGNAAEEGFGANLKISINGQGFTETSTAEVWGVDAKTHFINDTQLNITIVANFTNFPARIPIFVRNKGGALSNYEIFFVVPQPAKITSINPDTLQVGTGEVKFDVQATGLSLGATIVINDQALPTATVASGQLEATIPPSLISAPGQLIVRIFQEGTESKDMILDVAPTTGPFIYTTAPSRIREGIKKPTIDVVGANFTDGSTVTLDGKTLDKTIAKLKNKHDVVLKLKGADVLTQPGTHTLQVVDSSGNISNSTTFEITADVSVTTTSGGLTPHFGFHAGCVSSQDAQYRGPRRLALGPDGLIYIADQLNNAIRSVDPNSGELCTVAGNGTDGYNDTGNSRGFPIEFSSPNGVAVASDGTIYVTENGNSVIRRIERGAGGAVTVDTFAGTALVLSKILQDHRTDTLVGLPGQLDGPVLNSLIRQPDDIIIGPDGTIYFSDSANEDVRKIVQTPSGPVVQTIAGSGVPGFADGAGTSARFNTPTGIALSPDGKFLYVADFGNDRIRKVDLATSMVTTLTGTGDTGTADGPPGLSNFNGPIGLAVDTDGTIYVVEFGNSDVRRVDPLGNANTLTGGGVPRYLNGPGIVARFREPRGVAIDQVNRVLYIADFDNFAIRRIQLPQ
ncbi:MAG TPA: SMP-30/gluconolactonase/LRE family protein, partial [Blastocatellia bacterium]|nr:SMP-30/gluconolactonase/LRE family protein [Blastocatellia bacterium]